MHKDDISLMQDAFHQLVMATIKRADLPKELQYDFKYLIDLRETFHRERIRQELIDDVISYLKMMGCAGKYIPIHQSVEFSINLNKVAFSLAECLAFKDKLKKVPEEALA